LIERLLIAAGILVVNGAVLVLVLRLLTMVVIRRVPRTDEAAVAAPVPIAAPIAEPAVEEPEPELVAAAVAGSAVVASEPPAARVRTGRRGSNGHLYRIHHHRMLLGVPVLAAIFASGAWLGDWVGGGSSADAATVTVHLKGKTIWAAGAPVAVRVPGQTVRLKGRVVRVPGTTVQLPSKTQMLRSTVYSTINDTSTATTVITTEISVPTTITETTTDVTTVTETTTVTDTGTSSVATTT
jgi:hypothetical protein